MSAPERPRLPLGLLLLLLAALIAYVCGPAVLDVADMNDPDEDYFTDEDYAAHRTGWIEAEQLEQARTGR